MGVLWEGLAWVWAPSFIRQLHLLGELLFRHVQESCGWCGSTVKTWCVFDVDVSEVTNSRELAVPNVYQA